MERFEVEVRKKTKVFVFLSIASLLFFVLPLLGPAEYYFLSSIGFGLALAAIIIYVLSPKERKIIAEITGNILRFQSMRHAWFGVGSPYLSRPYEIDIPQIRKIIVQPWVTSGHGAAPSVYVGIHTEDQATDIWVAYLYQDKLNSFIKGLSTAYPSIQVEYTA